MSVEQWPWWALITRSRTRVPFVNVSFLGQKGASSATDTIQELLSPKAAEPTLHYTRPTASDDNPEPSKPADADADADKPTDTAPEAPKRMAPPAPQRRSSLEKPNPKSNTGAPLPPQRRSSLEKPKSPAPPPPTRASSLSKRTSTTSTASVGIYLHPLMTPYMSTFSLHSTRHAR